jgi:hypothetical protein
MSKQFIKDLLNVRFEQNFEPIITDGRFSMVNNTIANVNNAGERYQCDLSLTGDFQFAGHFKRSETVSGYTDYSGYNQKYITEDGVYDSSLAVAEFARTSIERRLVREETRAVLDRQDQGDSHESFLYNMLISWLKAHMYAQQEGKDYLFSVKTKHYEDSHVRVPLDRADAEHTYEIELGEPVDEDTIVLGNYAVRDKDNYWKQPYVLHYNAGGEGQEGFYLAHVHGRTRVSDLNFDVKIKGLNTAELLLDPVNGSNAVQLDLNKIPWDKPATIWSWIMDYTRLNRLEQAFAAALEVLGAMAIQPQWSSMEACVWQKAPLVVVLAQFKPTRARIRSNLEGEPYRPFAASAEFMLSEARCDENYFIASALTTYYMWYGLYTLLHNAGRELDDWRVVFNSMNDELQILKTPSMRAAAVSVATGKEYSTCMNYGCSVYVDTSPLESIYEMAVVPLDGSTLKKVPINAIFAPVSGCLVLGTLAGDFDVVQHLKGIQTICGYNADLEYKDLDELLPIVNMYRLFGHDVQLQDVLTKQIVQPWAPSRECIIEPSSIDFDIFEMKKLRVYDSEHREKRSHVLPNVRQLLKNGDTTMTIQQPTLKMTMFGRRTKEIRASVTRRRNKKEVKFLVKAPITYNSVAFTARAVDIKEKSGFRRKETEVPPTKPEGNKIETPPSHHDVTTEAQSGDALGAE